MNYRYIISQTFDPYDNLAMEQCLFDAVEKSLTVIFLWQNQHTIVIGKNQDVFAECKVEEFERDNGKIARRKSGGGAVYHDSGNLNFSIICKKEESEEVLYHRIIQSALSLIDVNPVFNGRNDLLLEGKKFSGNAVYDNGEILCQHGTLLIHSDIEKMAHYLTPDQAKLERNHVKSTSSRVVNLTELIPGMSVEKMKELIITGTKAVPLDKEIDQLALEEKRRFFSNKSWIYEGKV